MVRPFICAIALALVTTVLQAEIYQIPPELKKEVAQNKHYLEQHPTSANALFELAMSYAYTGQIEIGWETLKQIPDNDPNFAPKVVNKYSALIKQGPGNWKYHFKLAFGYYFKEDPEGAIASFERVIQIQPKNVWAMGFIALILGEQKEYEKAIKLCKKALKIEPNATAIHFLIAEGYRQTNHYMLMMKHALIVGRLKTEEKLAREKD